MLLGDDETHPGGREVPARYPIGGIRLHLPARPFQRRGI